VFRHETFRETLKARLAEMTAGSLPPDHWNGDAVEELEQHRATLLLREAVWPIRLI
jgi:hypothetical protein